MYARVSRYEVPKEKLEGDIKGTAETVKKVDVLPGELGVYYLVDRESGKTMSITLWESEQAMRDSESAASKLRQKTSSASSAKIVAIERYEVVAQPSQVPAGKL